MATIINKLDEFKTDIIKYFDKLILSIETKEKQLKDLDNKIRNAKVNNENLLRKINEHDK